MALPAKLPVLNTILRPLANNTLPPDVALMPLAPKYTLLPPAVCTDILLGFGFTVLVWVKVPILIVTKPRLAFVELPRIKSPLAILI